MAKVDKSKKVAKEAEVATKKKTAAPKKAPAAKPVAKKKTTDVVSKVVKAKESPVSVTISPDARNKEALGIILEFVTNLTYTIMDNPDNFKSIIGKATSKSVTKAEFKAVFEEVFPSLIMVICSEEELN